MGSFRDSCLSALQRDVLVRFAKHAPEWFLTGGGALAGIHYGHRTTEDLDLFASAERSSEEGEIALAAAASELGASLEPMVRTPDFKRFAVSRGEERTLVDLVIERVPQVVADKPVVDGVRVDPVREIAANKLSALMGRNAPRDLVDLREILSRGASLEGILADASIKDASADAATLAWVLARAPRIQASAVPAGSTAEGLEAFRAELVVRLRAMAAPSD
jgi:hypothetical protein